MTEALPLKSDFPVMLYEGNDVVIKPLDFL